MKLFSTPLAAVSAMFLAVSTQVPGCTPQDLPTVAQINLHLPKSIRTCPYAPKSPGSKATKKQVAKYLLELYNAWEECHGDLKTVNKLYGKWKKKVIASNPAICSSPASSPEFCRD